MPQSRLKAYREAVELLWDCTKDAGSKTAASQGVSIAMSCSRTMFVRIVELSKKIDPTDLLAYQIGTAKGTGAPSGHFDTVKCLPNTYAQKSRSVSTTARSSLYVVQ